MSLKRFAIGLSLLSCLSTGCSTSTVGPMPGVFPLRHSLPDWSVQGQIAYVDLGVVCVQPHGGYQVDNSKSGIWIYNTADRSRFRFLSSGDCPAWSADGQSLTVTVSRRIDTYRLDGQLVSSMPTTGLAVGPHWSHDGEYLVWEQVVEEPGIWLAHRDTLAPRRVSSQPGYASWHPNRLALLAIVADQEGRATFLEVSLQGKRDTLFKLDLVAVAPRYSPDAREIVFSAYSALTRRSELFQVRSDGKIPRRLTTHGGAEPCWRPNGLAIAHIRENHRSDDPSFNILASYDVVRDDVGTLVNAWPCDP